MEIVGRISSTHRCDSRLNSRFETVFHLHQASGKLSLILISNTICRWRSVLPFTSKFTVNDAQKLFFLALLIQIAQWTHDNHLKLNDDKTDLIFFCVKKKKLPDSCCFFSIGDVTFQGKEGIRNLGLILNRSLPCSHTQIPSPANVTRIFETSVKSESISLLTRQKWLFTRWSSAASITRTLSFVAFLRSCWESFKKCKIALRSWFLAPHVERRAVLKNRRFEFPHSHAWNRWSLPQKGSWARTWVPEAARLSCAAADGGK